MSSDNEEAVLVQAQRVPKSGWAPARYNDSSSWLPSGTTLCWVSAVWIAIFLAVSYSFGWIVIRAAQSNDSTPLFGGSAPSHAGDYGAATPSAPSYFNMTAAEKEAMFARFDYDNDGLLHLPEFQILLHTQMDETFVFDFMDFNGDGVVSANELVVAIEHIHDIEEAETALVRVEDGLMEELFGYTYTHHADGSVDQKYYEYNAQFVLYQFDADRDGNISRPDWNFYFAYDFFYVFDSNGDEVVSLEEFLSGSAVFESGDEVFGALDIDLASVMPSRDVFVSEAANFEFETSMDELYAIVDEVGEEAFADMVRRRLFWGTVLRVTMVTVGVVAIVGGAAAVATHGNPAGIAAVSGGITLIGAGLTAGK